MMMPKDYSRSLMKSGQREKASAFMEYMFDLDEKVNNSIGFYSKSWDKSKSTTHSWIKEFKEEIAKFHEYWVDENEKKYRTITERSPNDFEKKPNAKPNARKPINTRVSGDVPNGQPNTTPNDHRTITEQRVNTKILNTIKGDLSSNIKHDLFLEYLELRKKMKLSNSKTVITRLTNKLKKYEEAGLNPNVALEDAITGNWKDLYEPKVEANAKGERVWM
jgi:hypothetical protein